MASAKDGDVDESKKDERVDLEANDGNSKQHLMNHRWTKEEVTKNIYISRNIIKMDTDGSMMRAVHILQFVLPVSYRRA